MRFFGLLSPLPPAPQGDRPRPLRDDRPRRKFHPWRKVGVGLGLWVTLPWGGLGSWQAPALSAPAPLSRLENPLPDSPPFPLGDPTHSLLALGAEPQTLDPDLADLSQALDQGRQAYYRGQYTQAVTQWERVRQRLASSIAANPGDPPSLNRPLDDRTLAQIQTLNYLAVAYQDLSQWQQATATLEQSLKLLGLSSGDGIAPPLSSDPVVGLLQAQALNTRGNGELNQGQPQKALATWKLAEAQYAHLGNGAGEWGSRLNQARALQALGYYRQAKDHLEQLAAVVLPGEAGDPVEFTSGVPSATVGESGSAGATLRLKVSLLRNLAFALESLGDIPQSQKILEQALQHLEQSLEDQGSPEISAVPRVPPQLASQVIPSQVISSQVIPSQGKTSPETLSPSSLILPQELTATLIALGNITRVQGEWEQALDYYQQAQAYAPTPLMGLQSQLNQLRVLILLDRSPAIPPLLDQINQQWNTVEPSRASVYSKINFAASLLLLRTRAASLPPDLPASFRQQAGLLTLEDLPLDKVVRPLTLALGEARTLGDRRAEMQVLYQLSRLYGSLGQWRDSATVARQGLALASVLEAPDATAQLAWQLARSAVQQDDRPTALEAYHRAFTAIQNLRSDLLTVNPEVQLTFRETVEPLYREYVGVLLSPEAPITQEALYQAQGVMEALQLAELDNYFQDACVDSQPVAVDTLDPNAAVIYPMILSDRLEVIVSLPDRPLIHYRQPISRDSLQQSVQQLYDFIFRTNQPNAHLRLAQSFYNWLVAPAAEAIAAAQVQTLIFIPDGTLRRLPLGVLHTGEGYILEDYNIAVSPGLRLLPQGRQRRDLRVLGGGVAAARQGFAPLPGVAQEVAMLAETLDSPVLLDGDFTRQKLTQAIGRYPYSVVHLATHGQFSSDPEETFLLTWDDRIQLQDLEQIFSPRKIDPTPIELLVLSACQTAAGDDRAPLGLAGFALKSGARSTLASLWSVDDQATTTLMVEFYRQINASQGQISFAEALRQAQLSQIHSTEYSHPVFWSAFILLGNWL